MTRIAAEDIRVGDLLHLPIGGDRLITRITSYDGSRFTAAEARVAYSGETWCLTLVTGSSWHVSRPSP